MFLGYSLSSEEHAPGDLVRQAQCAEAAGFDFALISDHYHPWIDRQGQSPFVWCVIGAIAPATRSLRLGTGVTCPLIRIHPAIIAQAAATAAALMPDRFFLGLGTGENLNEHILGDHWPPAEVRLAMFEEAIQIIRELWRGEYCNYFGRYYTVEEARLYTRPEQPPPIYIASSGKRAATIAGTHGDGLIGLAPNSDLIAQFRSGGGHGKPCYGHITVCWANTRQEAQRLAHEMWPNAALGGNLSQEIKTPKLFQQAVKTLREEDVAETVICGPDPDPYLQRIHDFETAGYDHLYFHQVGPDQEGFVKFFERDLAPKISAGRSEAA